MEVEKGGNQSDWLRIKGCHTSMLAAGGMLLKGKLGVLAPPGGRVASGQYQVQDVKSNVKESERKDRGN